MSSEKTASAVNILKGDLAAGWNLLEGSSADYTDLGIARRFGGSSAAYSLRDIGAMNGRVVKARRSEDDLEEDFSANQVQSGILEDWVNGKLESTLPADVDTAAATYSLRKAKADYSGDAVRIRRSSDDVEVNVAFDSDDKVSTSSSISVVSGSTSATDLNGFLNETLTVGVAVEGGSGADRPDSFTNATNSSFTATVTGIAGGYFPYKSAAGDAVTVSFDLVLSVGSSPSLNTSLGVSTVATRAAGTAYNSSGSYTFTLNCNASADHIRFADGDDGTFSVTNFRVVSHTHSAFVHTWYDQAGSNDATQATDANQPKIAEGGALLTDGLDFDGVNDYLEADGLSSIYTGTDKAHSSFVVVNSDAATTTQYILGIGSTSISNPLRNTLFHSGGNIGWQVRDDAGTLKTDLSANPYVANQTYLVSTLNSGTTIDFNTNSVINDNGTDGDVGASTIDTVHIGTRANSPTGYLNGSIQELVFYASDQSANRFKIESNINNYYGLYNDADDLAGNFTVNSSGTGTDASISNESKTGFTATVVDKAGFFGADLNEAVPNGSNLYISFIANLSPSGGTAATPNFGLANSADKTGNSTGNPLDTAVVEGFNSITVAGTASTCDRIRFTEGNDDVSFIISDLRVSRIARNGFVETWYDQSGNGIDMSQGTAGSQPTIVKNGGQVKSSNNLPAITFADNAVHLERAEFLTGQLGGYFIVGNALKADQDGTDAQVILRQGSSYRIAVELINAGNIRSFLRDGAGDDADARTSSTTVGDDEVFLNTTILTARGSTGLANYFNGGDESTANTTDVEDTNFSSVDSGNISIGSIPAGTFDYKGELMEVILFNTNVSSDRTTIETEINNHYNIY